MSIRFIGLPGSGISRLNRNNAALVPSLSGSLLVVDIRSRVPHSELGVLAEDFLKKSLGCVDGVVFMFVESADLEVQSYWQSWCREHAPQLSIFRSFYDQVDLPHYSGKQPLKQSLSQSLTPTLNPPNLALEQLVFEVATINLEHFLMSLDAAVNSLGMKIFRIKGCVDTSEYENPVRIEGTYNRIDTFGEEMGADLSAILIEGVDLDQAWLKQVIQASEL